MSKIVKLADGKISMENTGRFQLIVKTRDAKKFRVTNISGFVPKGQKIDKAVKLLDPSGKEVDTLLIDKIKTTFYPDDNEIDAHNIMAFIQHPDVFLEGMPEEQWKLLIEKQEKKKDCSFTLVNIDKLESIDFDKETELLEARNILYSRKTPLQKERLVWLCSALNIPYASKITDTEKYRQQLIKKLDNFIQNETEKENEKTNLQRFVFLVDNIKTTEYLYYINNLKELDVIVNYSGVYKVGDKPVGASVDDIIEFYESNPEVFNHHKKMVIQNKKDTIMA